MEADLNLDVSLEACFQDGGDVSSQVPEMGGLQFPNRLARQLLQSRTPQTNQLGGVVLQVPGAQGALGAPGAPLQTLTPSQQALHSSLTAIHNVRKSKTLKHNHFCWNYASGKLTYFFPTIRR